MMHRTINLSVGDVITIKLHMMAPEGVGGKESFDLGEMTGGAILLARPRN